MTDRARIVVVEDESIVAMDIKNRLTKLGYEVPAVADTGEGAIQKAQDTQPDLMLVDIVLKGEMDGIEAAEHIHKLIDVPVVYLTAHSDLNTLERAKLSKPYGYITKPFEERELHTNIEIALYKHQMEKRLKESERWLDTTLRSISDAVIATDEHGRIRFMNNMAETLTGWLEQDALGVHLDSVFTIVDEVNKKRRENPVKTVLRQGRIVRMVNQVLLIAKDGSEVPIDNSASPIKNETGQISGAVLIFRDLTERKRLLNQSLQSQKMEAIGRLAGGVSHDFNNILTIILGNADFALMEVDEDHPLVPTLQEIKNAGKHAASLTKQLLMFSRKGLLNPKPCNLNVIVTETESMLRRLIGEDIEFEVLLDEKLHRIDAAPGQIQQVIMNLAVNARDAMPKGGKLTIETKNKELDEIYMQNRDGAIAPGSYVMMAVSDDGMGMNNETLSHIFEPFFTTKSAGKGTGLGLATVYGIVKQSGGFIWVYSEPNRGTTFKVFFPRSALAAPATSPKPELAVSPEGCETILVVEDNDMLRGTARRLLEKCGYRILEAQNGKDALDVGRNFDEPIHVVLTDIVMPGMSGRELAERIQSLRPDIKIIFMSGYTDHAVINNDLAGRNVHFLQKPFSFDDMTGLVRKVLDA